MSKGRRYNGEEQQLNMKKVFGVVIVILVVILFIFGIKKLLKADKGTLAGKNIEMAYFPLFENGNWGVINSSGNKVIEPAYAEMIMIPNKSKAVFICTQNVNYVDGTYETKAINDKNQEIYTEYGNVMPIQNHDKNNVFWYEENVLRVQQEGKFGLINIDGGKILDCEYDSITPIKGVKNSIIIKKEGKTGLVNSAGKIIVPVEYVDVLAIGENYYNGYIVKNAEGKFGVIDADGNEIFECKYEGIKPTTDSGMYIVKEAEGGWKVSLKDGTSYLEGKVANATEIVANNVVVNNNGKYGIYNIETDLKVPEEYQFLAYAFEDKYIAKKEGKYGIINLNNEVVVDFQYADMKCNKGKDYIKAKISDGNYAYINKSGQIKATAGEEKALENGYISLTVNGEVKYFNNKLEEKSNKDAYSASTLFVVKKDGKYGYIDKSGKQVVECIYEDATEQNDYGFSAVKKDGKWGAIDQYGKVVVSPLYTINNGRTVDFIGKWHACADTNANYYTDVE